MQHFKKLTSQKIIFIIAVFLSIYIIRIGAYSRWLGYERIPDLGIMDERDYALLGLSLRNSGIPAAWSLSNVYNRGPSPETLHSEFIDLNITAFGVKPNLKNYFRFPKPTYIVREYDFGFGQQQINFVQPFMDHPPIGGLISSLGFKNKVSNFVEITPDKYRLPSLYIGVINSILFFIFSLLLTKNLFVATLAIAIYNSVPTYILSSRFALLENYLVPFTLLQLIFLLLSKSSYQHRSKLLIISAIVSGIGMLVKETGVGFTLGCFLLLTLWSYTKKEKFLYLVFSIIPPTIYVLWSLWLSSETFFATTIFSSSRAFFGPLAFLSILPSLRFEHFPFDGWYLWGFLSFFIIGFSKFKKYNALIIPTLCYTLAILFIPNPNFPWYFLGVLPFLIISSAIVLVSIANQPRLLTVIAFALIPLSSSLYWGNTVFNLPPNINTYRLVIFGFIAIGAIRIFKHKSKIIRFLWVLSCLVIFYEVFKWNRFSILYVIDHWGHYPVLSLPAL